MKSRLINAAALTLTICVSILPVPTAAQAQTREATETLTRVFSNQWIIDNAVASMNPPSRYRELVQDHFETLFGHPDVQAYFVRNLAPSLDALGGMTEEAVSRFGRQLGAGAAAELITGGMTRIPADDLLFLIMVTEYALRQSSPSDCARSMREEMSPGEMTRWEASHIFSLREEDVRAYFRTIRSAAIAEASGRPARRGLTISQRDAAQTILEQRMTVLFRNGSMNGAILDPASASEADFCNDIRALMRLLVEEEGSAGDWLRLHVSLHAI